MRQRMTVDKPKARRAAVLVPLLGSQAAPDVLYCERTHDVLDHKGEICFPGGSCEADDDGPVGTALREAYEELGLRPHDVQIIGLLDDVETHVSNYTITPVVGFIEGLPPLQLDPLEVGRIIMVPLARLFEPGVASTRVRQVEGVQCLIYAYTFDENCVWGATGRITHALIDILDPFTNDATDR
ncbi:MAG: CoA pyrophosphatase [Candidatus Eremiobacteraeota bacterium]|nr:CoA pyrophosphatase [Candidatus Eremiobacteraeota bacterium]